METYKADERLKEKCSFQVSDCMYPYAATMYRLLQTKQFSLLSFMNVSSLLNNVFNVLMFAAVGPVLSPTFHAHQE